ncbi:MAG TPA: hypothetical protein VF486_00365 [Actinomycetes bacterium]
MEPRFCGPPGFANGGFASGSLAALLGGTAEVTLRRPVPLGRALPVRRDGDHSLVVEDAGVVLAEARPAEVELAVPDRLTAEEADAAAGRLRYYDAPVFPACFACGPARAPGDGLRILPGRVDGRPLWAAPWTPDRSVAGADGQVRPEVVWAALDCPSGLAAADAAGLPDGTMILLGRMAADLAAPPGPGDRCRVVAWPVVRDGRKLTAGSALLGAGGEVLAAARTTWIIAQRSFANAGAPHPEASTTSGRGGPG